MREAIGSALLLNIVLVIIGVISLFLINSIAYSKAFKVKDRIISVIEKYDGNCNFDDDNNECYREIENVVTDMGYSSNISSDCRSVDELVGSNKDKKATGILSVELVYPKLNDNRGHKYCVYKYVMCDIVQNGSDSYTCSGSNINTYYKVIAFMHFDIPVIENFLEFEVSGETKSFYDTFINLRNW